MKPGQNFNHPTKGSVTMVDPIRSLDKIKKIKETLNPRNRCLFTIGINTNLTASDILRLKVAQVENLKPGDDLVLRERKTGKIRRITINNAVYKSIRAYLKTIGKQELLFDLTVPYFSRLVKSWCKQAGLKGNYGAHSLRKTWGYQQRVLYKVDIPTLMVCFNHSSEKQTLAYLGIQPESIKNTYQNEL